MKCNVFARERESRKDGPFDDRRKAEIIAWKNEKPQCVKTEAYRIENVSYRMKM